MNNTELTLDQLSEVSGGAAFMKLGDIKAAKLNEKQVMGFTTGGGGDSFKQQIYALRSDNRF